MSAIEEIKAAITTLPPDDYARFRHWFYEKDSERQQQGALEIRRQWMQMMGLSAKEIDEHCEPGTPADLDDEIGEYNAMVEIQKLNQRMKDRD